MLAKSDSPTPSRALVTLADNHHEPHAHRPVQRGSSFLAHVIACASRAPQARQRRRAEAAEVIAAYRATVERLQTLNEESE
jgi:hypothetical protein